MAKYKDEGDSEQVEQEFFEMFGFKPTPEELEDYLNEMGED